MTRYLGSAIDASVQPVVQLSELASQTARNAVATGKRAARMAGKRPPRVRSRTPTRCPCDEPRTDAQIEDQLTGGWTAARGADCVPLKNSHARTAPIAPPSRASRSASASTEMTIAVAPKPMRAQRCDLAQARADGGVHRVERAEDRADGHDAADDVSDDRDDLARSFSTAARNIRVRAHVHARAPDSRSANP